MKRVYFDQGSISIQDAPMPAAGPGEVLIRVLMAGICNTDVELFKGYYGFRGVPGHEFVGVVEELGSGIDAATATALLGQRVVADINIAAGSGDHRHTAGRSVLGIVGKDGAFAQYLTIPATNCHVLPAELATQDAVFAEPLAAALEVGQQVHLRATDHIAVIGDGKLGILIALALRHSCPGIVLVGKHPEKLTIAQKQGVRTVLLQDAATLSGLDVVVEASGSPTGLATALDLVRPEGTIVLKTTTHAPTPLDMARVVVNELTLVGSRCGDMALAVHYLNDGLVDVRELVEAHFPFEHFEIAFNSARNKGAKKVLLFFSN